MNADDVSVASVGSGDSDCTGAVGFFTDAPAAAPCGLATPGAGVAALLVSVKGRQITHDVPKMIHWPSQISTFRLEALGVQLSVDITWASGHTEETVLSLMPQAGVQVPIGGPPEEGDRWTPMMITGEKHIEVTATEATTSTPKPSNNIMRAVCQHMWEQDAHDPDSDIVEEDESEVGGPSQDEHFTVTGGKTGLAGHDAEKIDHVVAAGFCFRLRLNVTATLYLSRATADGLSSHHALVINSTGTLEVRPRIVKLSRIKPCRILTAAQEDANRGDHSYALQKWKHALPLQERLAKNTGGRENAKLAGVLHSMGVSYNALGNGRDALACLRSALAIRQHLHGEEHPDSAKTLQAIGVVRVRDGEYHEAFEYFWQALRYYEVYDPECLDAASTLQAVAGVYGKLGEYSEALECYLRAASIRERELGRDNLEYATTLHNLGVVFEKMSEHTEALDSLQQALAIREEKLGPAHPQTARTLHSIGIVHSQLLDYPAALTFYQRAFDICEKLPGEGTHAAATLNNMGVVYAKLGQTETAIEHHEHALGIQDKILGPDHADTLATRYNLHVLVMELEQSQHKTLFSRFKALVTDNTCAPDSDFRKGKIAPSLFALLCEEADEVDGPIDEPCCCCACCRCASTRTLLHREDGLAVITRDQKAAKPARLGFPQPRKRGGTYPAPPPDPVQFQDEAHQRSGTKLPQRLESWDCKNCKLSL